MEHQTIDQETSTKKAEIQSIWKSLILFALGIIITIFITHFIYTDLKEEIEMEFEFNCKELKAKIDARLKAHSQLLRSGVAFFASSDSVTREEWKNYNINSKFSKNLPGIQGIGYAMIIPKNNLANHIRKMRDSGFPDYNVYPKGDREIYTSIIYLEPFSGTNIAAIGFDMYSESVRRKAMEIARDSDIASLSGKVYLVQETGKNKQAGTLMYVPVYNNHMPVNTVEERRKAIKGWVYSPYRMDDLMNQVLGIYGTENKKHINLKICDNNIPSDEDLLYETNIKYINPNHQPNLFYQIQLNFHGKIWNLVFAQHNPELSVLNDQVIIFFISGIIISVLLLAFSLMFFKTRLRVKQIDLLNKELQKLNIDKDRFISVLAHDLRNPFNTLIGFSDLLVRNIKKYDQDQIVYKATTIHKTAKQTFQLLNELLIWARSQSGKLTFEPNQLNLFEIVNETLESTEIQAESKDITIKYSALDNIEIYADTNMLKTIIRNLVSNAIKFTNQGGNIEIYAERGTSEVLIRVSDNGIGIRAEVIDSIFNFTDNQSTSGTNLERGTGWGLKLCKEFVEKHGGKIWVESQTGKGSDFFFTIPNKP
jgi:signal transduction histidine kinase